MPIRPHPHRPAWAAALGAALALAGPAPAGAADSYSIQVVRTWPQATVDHSTSALTRSMTFTNVNLFNDLRTGNAQADAGTGLLRAYAGVTRDAVAQTSPYFGGSNLGIGFGASLSIPLTIVGSGGNVPIEVEMAVNGEVFTSGAGSGSVAGLGYAAGEFSLDLYGSGISTDGASLRIRADGYNNKSFIASGDVDAPSVNGGVLHASAVVHGGSVVNLAFSSAAYAYAPPKAFAQAAADLSHTATFRITLPAGYGFVAPVEGFLATPAWPPAPVPEPPALLLWLGGLLALGHRLRQRLARHA